MADILDPPGVVNFSQIKRELFAKSEKKDKDIDPDVEKENRFWLTRYELRLLQTGQTPFEYLLEVMRDKFNPPDIRMKAATTLMPYVQQMAPRSMELNDPSELTPIQMREANIVREKLAALVGIVLTPSASDNGQNNG